MTPTRVDEDGVPMFVQLVAYNGAGRWIEATTTDYRVIYIMIEELPRTEAAIAWEGSYYHRPQPINGNLRDSQLRVAMKDDVVFDMYAEVDAYVAKYQELWTNE